MSKQQSIRTAETRGFLFTNIVALVWKSTTMSTVYNDLCSLHILFPRFSTFTHFYLFFFFFEGEAISFQNNLFHHLTMKSKIDYQSLIMMIISILIFSKKELLIKRKKNVKVISKNLIIGKLRLLGTIITDGKVYLFTYYK